MKQIIVNADDFGISKTVNREIEQSIIDGCISSTTLMANGKCLVEAIEFAKKHQEVSYGVHLCISEFDSITKSPILRKYGLIDSDGYFIRMQVFKLCRFNSELKEAIREELLAQIRKIKSYGLPLSHCDSHHHSHTIYGLHQVFADVIKDEGFTKVRIPRSVSTYGLFRYPIISQKRLAVARYYKKHFLTTDCFSSYAEFLKAPLKNSNSRIELMCHPGHESFLEEYEAVRKKLALKDGVRLISYKEL